MSIKYFLYREVFNQYKLAAIKSCLCWLLCVQLSVSHVYSHCSSFQLRSNNIQISSRFKSLKTSKEETQGEGEIRGTDNLHSAASQEFAERVTQNGACFNAFVGSSGEIQMVLDNDYSPSPHFFFACVCLLLIGNARGMLWDIKIAFLSMSWGSSA